MGERNYRVVSGQLWGVPLPDGPLFPPGPPAAAAKICNGTVGGHCRLQQSLGAGLRLHEQQGWSCDSGTGIPDVPGWAQRSVLGFFWFSKAVFLLPETGESGIVQPSARLNY